MVVPSALPLKLICDVTRLWRNLPPSEIFCVRHCCDRIVSWFFLWKGCAAFISCFWLSHSRFGQLSSRALPSRCCAFQVGRTVARKSSIWVFTFVQGDLTLKIWWNLHWITLLHISIWGCWCFVWGAAPTKAPPPWRRDCKYVLCKNRLYVPV